MRKLAFVCLVLRAWAELVHYDVVHTVRGFGGIRHGLSRRKTTPHSSDLAAERRICDAIALATCLYWKPVLCLQRAVCTTRILRAHGLPALTIIGYREAPFFSHAWVEVDARVVNDSPAYRQRLRVLYAM